MFRNKYYVILGILAATTITTQIAFAQSKKEDITNQIPLIKEYSKRGENDKAIKLAQEILQSDPNNIVALNLLTETYLNMDNLRAAEETAKKGLALKPNDPVSCRLLARIYRIKAEKNPKVANDNLTLALEQVQKGLVSNPNDIMLLAEEAQIYSEQGYKSKADQVITRALTISPNDKHLKRVKEMIGARKIEEKKTSK